MSGHLAEVRIWATSLSFFCRFWSGHTPISVKTNILSEQ